jgi:hypothetical protein
MQSPSSAIPPSPQRRRKRRRRPVLRLPVKPPLGLLKTEPAFTFRTRITTWFARYDGRKWQLTRLESNNNAASRTRDASHL